MYQPKTCKVCGKEFQPTAGNQQTCSQHGGRKAYMKVYTKAYNASHFEEIVSRRKAYHKEHPEIGRASNARRHRTLRYVLLNKEFRGCEGHHVDDEQVINMPKKLHRSISHNVRTGRNMSRINAVAYNFLFKQEVDAALRR